MRARKRFGQHFLHDPAVIERIIAAIDPRPGQALVEIGPGRGALTGALLAAGSSLAEIADALGASYKTIANTCTLIKSKLGVARTADLVRLAIETGVS